MKWLVALLCILVTAEARAQSDNSLPEVTALYKLTVYPSLPREQRPDIAKKIHNWCFAVMADIPTNTPEEDAWAEKEASTTDLDRIRRLDHTPEWGRRQLSEAFTTCKTTAMQLVAAQDAGNRKAEAASFMSLAANFNGDADMQIYAGNARIDAHHFGIYRISAFRWMMIISALRSIEEIP